MWRFEYTPLSPDRDIRLVTLLAGNSADDICIKISHAPFLEPGVVGKEPSPRITLKGLQETLPDGWMVRETIGGRYLFISTINLNATTWTHPDPGMDPQKYTGYPKDQLDGYNPQFEALSYSWGKDAAIHRIYVKNEDSPSKSSIGTFKYAQALKVP